MLLHNQLQHEAGIIYDITNHISEIQKSLNVDSARWEWEFQIHLININNARLSFTLLKEYQFLF